MAYNEDNSKTLLAISIYVGVIAILYFLLGSFKHVTWLKFVLAVVMLAWVAGGYLASFSIAYDGIDTEDRFVRYVLIFIAALLLVLFAYCDHNGNVGY